MPATTSETVYHVLLIGIDAYPSNSLWGAVNDIDAIEALLLEPPGIGLPADQIRITRLAAPRPNRPSSSRFQEQTLVPSKAKVVAALRNLASPEVVRATDRVLVYYSGHGRQEQWQGSSVWHEALALSDGQKVEPLFDVEVNGLIQAIAARTTDLTILLDCCHAAGATRGPRDATPLGSDRYIPGDREPAPPPDLAALGLPVDAPAGTRSAPMLSSLDPSYLAVVACQPDERASEFAARDETRVLGILTYALLGLLASRNDEERSRLRWADLWPQLLDGVAARCRQGSRRAQHPSLIGRSERRVFGGTWQEQDPGYRITSLDDGRYRIAAGTLMGLTRGAEVAIYGPEPARFPPIGSEEDSPVGRLRVLAAERAECTAEAMGATFATEGARARLVKPGEGERLSVSLDPENSALAEELALSPLLKIVPAGSPDADVEVVREVGGGWIIGDDVEAALARVRPGDTEALRSGLEWCYRGQAALRLAYRCTDPQLSRSLHLELLDCSNAEALEAMSPQEQADPKLPLAPRDDAGIYQVPPASQWCVRVTNRSESTLMVHVLRCSAGGSVELLGDATLRPRASHVLWQGDRFGDAFSARGDWLPRQRGAEPRRFVTDRLLAIGTNRSGVDLSALLADRTVQEVVRETVRGDGPRGSRLLNQPAAAPAELWTAAIVPMRIRR